MAGYKLAYPNRELLVTCTHRSPEEQAELYKQGRVFKEDGTLASITPSQVVTYCDGTHKVSEHNCLPARALDFAIVIGGKITWNDQEYEAVGKLAEAAGLEWGGSWRTFKDRPHIQLKRV